MALQAISYFCTMPILFHKLEGFPGKMPWGLPVTLAVTKPGLWRCGLHLDSPPVSSLPRPHHVQKGSVKGSCAPRQESSLSGKATAQHLPSQGPWSSIRMCSKLRVSPRNPGLGYFLLLCWRLTRLKICHLFGLMTYCWNNLVKMTYLDPQLLIFRTACKTSCFIFSYLCPAFFMFQDSTIY